MSIDFSTLQGLTIPEGVVTQIADASGRVLWSANMWPKDLDTGLEFASASAFTMSVGIVGWDGTMEYCNGKGWQTWDGSEISSGETDSGQCIYIRGTGNTKVTGAHDDRYALILSGTGIECNGNIENLLDYATVEAGTHPSMATYCYSSMFSGCTSLTTAPSLPATTLVTHCYSSMFSGCTSLTTAPSLPATTLASSCYYMMFNNCTSLVAIPSLPATTLATNCYAWLFYKCTKVKLSDTATDTYTKAYRIPYSGTGTTATNAFKYMFTSTGGTFTGTPSINTTYYLDSSNSIV